MEDKEQILLILLLAIDTLMEQQPDILDETPQTTLTKWNIGYHLTNAIRPHFPLLELDTDVIKKDYGRKRPDMIFHRTGINTENMLVIELRFNGSKRDLATDERKSERAGLKNR